MQPPPLRKGTRSGAAWAIEPMQDRWAGPSTVRVNAQTSVPSIQVTEIILHEVSWCHKWCAKLVSLGVTGIVSVAGLYIRGRDPVQAQNSYTFDAGGVAMGAQRSFNHRRSLSEQQHVPAQSQRPSACWHEQRVNMTHTRALRSLGQVLSSSGASTRDTAARKSTRLVRNDSTAAPHYSIPPRYTVVSR